MTTTERVALVTWELSNGRELTTAEIAAMTEQTPVGAYLMMCRISRNLPIVLLKKRGAGIARWVRYAPMDEAVITR